MKPHVFGIGTGKTGSNSLCVALKKLGLSAYHCGNETYHKNGNLHSQVIKNFNENTDPLRGVDGVHAILDWPIFRMFKAIDATVPQAKFILTYRNPDECAISWCRMVSQQHEKNKSWLTKDNRSYKNYAAMVRNHNDSVLEHFFGRPDQLLILDINDRDETKWRLLKNFLGVTKPIDEPYPNEFNHKDWQV
tara:strand:- start:394 stop:966 length:573 start_codon:yes stop_codon:yes gene_type:complete